MMKRGILTIWLLLPAALLAFHYGPGQRQLARDHAARWLAEARAAEADANWTAAGEAYAKALASLPESDQAARCQVQLARANARIYVGELPEAITDLQNLLGEATKQSLGPGLIRDVRGALAAAQYYAGWLMRLEGAPKEEWTLEVDQARQHFRLLAEETQTAHSAASAEYQKNLEAVIRLARMDLSELQALPIPKQCHGCKNCSQRNRSQRESRNPELKEQPKDARGASVGKRPEGSGS